MITTSIKITPSNAAAIEQALATENQGLPGVEQLYTRYADIEELARRASENLRELTCSQAIDGVRDLRMAFVSGTQEEDHCPDRTLVQLVWDSAAGYWTLIWVASVNLRNSFVSRVMTSVTPDTYKRILDVAGCHLGPSFDPAGFSRRHAVVVRHSAPAAA